MAYEIEVTPEMTGLLEEIAKERGVTYEMAVRMMVEEALEMAKADPEGFAARMRDRDRS